MPTQVVIFARRCGLRRYAQQIRRFGVDGALLMTLDPEDYRLLGVTNPVHVKKVGDPVSFSRPLVARVEGVGMWARGQQEGVAGILAGVSYGVAGSSA